MENAPTVHELLTAAAAGRGGALVLAGAIGEGRTTTLRAAAAGLDGWTVLAAPGYADESTLSGAGLQRLLAPLASPLTSLDAGPLASPEAEPLASVDGGPLASPGAGPFASLEAGPLASLGAGPLASFGAGSIALLSAGPLASLVAGRELPEPLVLALSLQALLRKVTASGPVLCLLDDADLLDPLSWQQMRMLARRIHDLPVAILASVTSDAAAGGLPTRRLTPLDAEASHALIRQHAPDVTAEVASALTALAEGHPAALAELAASLTPQQRRGLAPPPVSLPARSPLRLRFRTALDALPEATRRLLLLAAADPAARPSDLIAAAGRVATTGTETRRPDARASANQPVGFNAEPEESAPLPANQPVGSGAEPGSEPDRTASALANQPVGLDAERGNEPGRAPSALANQPVGFDAERGNMPGRAASALANQTVGFVTEAAGETGRAVLASADGVGIGIGDLEPAERAGLIVADADGVRFQPGVLRLVAYDEEPIGRRQAAHLALAEVLGSRGRTLQALLHRAAVAAAPDDDLARDLLIAAEAAPPPEAFAAQRYAADLSGTPAGEARALLQAARSAMAAGRPQDARPLLRRAAQLRGSAAVRGRAQALIAEMRLRRAPAESREALLDVAGELMTADPAGAVEALLVAGEACGRTGEPGRYPRLARQAAARCRDGRPATDMALHQVVGLADLMTGDHDTAFGHLREVLRLADHTSDPAALTRAASTGILLGQDRRAARLARRAVILARETGNAPLVPEALEVTAFAELAAGRHDAATEAALDGAAVARAAGRPDLADAHDDLLGLLAAFRGDVETSRERRGALGDWAEALLDLVAGRPESAAERLARIARTGSMTLRVAIAPHLVEAGGSGSDVFDEWAARTRQPGWLALRSRCRALTEAEAADDYFREALGWHDRDEDAGFALAHTELLYGRHLRRRRRPAEARDHLRRAVEHFHRFDAQPWAEQAARELRAAGERIGPVGRAPLTAQQERIAGLVAEGATNREVAQQLHLSPRTIDHHLRNVFARLGVRSRTELARLLAG
ncbi:LuxR C-terminal-related transcriptional regulator [Actinoplanes sp. Pm04-4]|uniref:LuxR C-terminal-related transcriptional regulator n=1 Tax=Paractinoplanes pyxinae TaxID=2997416 RepID=A0ABT4B3U8_9ACTN|nr:LuxR family transcriptional regulator [Actinoplanes pyxinae]MCY1141151.1 LuxR C-terminal-related transcriptional regulator [Actinoplanes pyxinae]